MKSFVSIAEYDNPSANGNGNFTSVTITADGISKIRKSSNRGSTRKMKRNGKAINQKTNSDLPRPLLKIQLFLLDLRQSITKNLTELFLPIGYPTTTNPGYIQYQIYDSIQGLSSYLRGVVSTSAVLVAAGVGNAEATATSAAVQWALKDGFGMIGGLLFSYISSSKFDSHVKEFRLFADVINDVGLCLDMLCPLVDQKHIMMVSALATLCRVMCGMAAGATKNCITQHFARGNMADLSAKEGTQETLVNLVGMFFGIRLAKFLQGMEKDYALLQSFYAEGKEYPQSALSLFFLKHGSVCATWFVFLFLTAIHIWANYAGVKILKLKTLNQERSRKALNKVITRMVMLVEIKDAVLDEKSILQDILHAEEHSKVVDAFVLTPEKCSECMWTSWKNLFLGDNLRLGAKVSDALQGLSLDEIKKVLYLFKRENYILTFQNDQIFVCLRQRSHHHTSSKDKHSDSHKEDYVISDRDKNLRLLKSFVHALIIQQYLIKYDKEIGNTVSYNRDYAIAVLKRSKKCVDGLFPTHGMTLLDLLVEKGWTADTLHLNYANLRFDIN